MPIYDADRCERAHAGIDITALLGTPIVAGADGIVVFAGWANSGAGNVVTIEVVVEDAPDVVLLRHIHCLSNFPVRVGDHVKAGDVIGYVGSTGASISRCSRPPRFPY